LVAQATACAEADDAHIPPAVSQPEPEPEPTTPPPATCQEASAAETVSPAQNNLVFLLDRSASMHKTIGGGQTRWTATRDGLFTLLDTFPTDTWAGLSVFPDGDAPISCCFVNEQNRLDCNACAKGERPSGEVRCDEGTYSSVLTGIAALGSGHVETIKSTVSSSDELMYWGTPMAPALSGVLDNVTGSPLPGVTSIVLLTDGNPAKCKTGNDPEGDSLERVLDVVAMGNSAGVRTYVVGIDAVGVGTDTDAPLSTNLSKIAFAAGTGRFGGCEQSDECAYMVNGETFEASLDAALQSVAKDATSCAFDFPQVAGGQPDLDGTVVTVKAGGDSVEVSRDETHVNGWDVLPGNQQVQLYGAACEQLKSDEQAEVAIAVACTPN
jgi:hypothetical protein